MGVYIKYNMLVTVTEPKTFCFDLPKEFDKNLKHEIDFIIKYNEVLSNHTAIDKIIWLSSNYRSENDIYEHRN